MPPDISSLDRLLENMAILIVKDTLKQKRTPHSQENLVMQAVRRHVNYLLCNSERLAKFRAVIESHPEAQAAIEQRLSALIREKIGNLVEALGALHLFLSGEENAPGSTETAIFPMRRPDSPEVD